MNKHLGIYGISFSLLVTLLLTIGCAQKNNQVDNGGGALESATLVIATPTQNSSWVDEQIPYPTSPEGFFLNAGGSETQVPTDMAAAVTEGFILESRDIRLGDRYEISDLGFSDKIAKVEGIYRAELTRDGKDYHDYFINSTFWRIGDKPYWYSVVQDPNEHFLAVKINQGVDAGKIKIGIADYFPEFTYQDDFFDLFVIDNPPGLEDAEQTVLWDKSGNLIISIFNVKGYLSAWFNVAKGEMGEWELVALPAGETEAQDIWQLSPEGHVYYNEKELYGGLFTINKEHPEYVEKYWEDTIRGLWNLNYVAEKYSFIDQFPTADLLIKYLQEGGGPVSGLWIPVIYPVGGSHDDMAATMEKIEGSIDLSKIAIAIYKPTRQEIYHYSPDYITGTRYVHYLGAQGSVFVEKFSVGSDNILRLTFRQNLLVDTFFGLENDGTEVSLPALTSHKNPSENLLAATILVRYWPLMMNAQVNPDPSTGWETWKGGMTPPKFEFLVRPLIKDFKKIYTIDSTPLKIR